MLIPKRRGKLRSVQITPRSHALVTKWAEEHGYQLASVVETAIKEFCERHANDPTSDDDFIAPTATRTPPEPQADESMLCSVCAADASASKPDEHGDRYCAECAA